MNFKNIPPVTFRMLKQFLTLGAPLWSLMYLQRKVEDEPQTTESLMRDVLSWAVFDPARVLTQVAILDFPRRSGKDYSAAAARETLPVILKHEWDRVVLQAESARSQPWVATLMKLEDSRLMIPADASWAPKEEEDANKRLQLSATPQLIAGCLPHSSSPRPKAVLAVKSVPKLHGWQGLVRKTGWDLEVTFDTIAAGLFDQEHEGEPSYLTTFPYLLLVEEKHPHRTQLVEVGAAHVVATMLRRLWRAVERGDEWEDLHEPPIVFNAGHTDDRLNQLA